LPIIPDENFSLQWLWFLSKTTLRTILIIIFIYKYSFQPTTVWKRQTPNATYRETNAFFHSQIF